MASPAASSSLAAPPPPPSSSASPKLHHNTRNPLPTLASTTPPTTRALRRPAPRKSSGIGRINTTATTTPNSRGAYSYANGASTSTLTSPVPSLPLQRKGSRAALSPTSHSLASLPDASQNYALANLNTSPTRSHNNRMALSPLTPRAAASFGAELSVGDTVEVPGNMLGVVRFVGGVQGKKGIFTGVELLPDFAARGKNNGDVDGVSYFTTSVPGAGIFLPLNKAVRRDSPADSTTSSFHIAPASAANGLKAGTQNSTNHAPNTSAAAQTGQSLGPGRASSPLGKKSRPSLSRPESPLRKLQTTPGARPSMGAAPSRNNMPRFNSPTQTKYSQSVRGPGPPTPGGDPNKGRSLQPGRNFSMGPRSISALSARSQGFAMDEDVTPVGNGVARPREAGRVAASRGPSRQDMAYDEEIERLRAEVADRDRQLREQQAALTEMENSLTEVQSLMEQADLPAAPVRCGSLDDKDTTQLRALIKDKNEMIARLTAEFDANRADFRSTIDTLELASTETERVYEKKIEELMQDIHAIQERNSDVDAVATQLRQLEELVQELEEGLEDARRGEAEARGEVEFLRGEVERTRAELRREREKATGGGTANNNTSGVSHSDQSALFKDLEQKEDEIRGLKAIIHSLSRDSVPSNDEGDRPPASAEDTAAREKLEREVAELRALLDTKNTHEEQMEHELDTLRRGSASTLRSSDAFRADNRSSVRDSRDTVVMAVARDRTSINNQPPSAQRQQHKTHLRVRTLDTQPESDDMSSITENSTLWCELCETSGHDILTCTNMFGAGGGDSQKGGVVTATGSGGLAPISEQDQYKIAPLSPRLPLPPPPPPPQAAYKAPPPSMMDPGPVAGKESGVIDSEAWCALCEKDGHTSVDCPFEDAF